MTYIIPNQQTKQLRQLNKGDLSGELAVTRNVNLDDEGYISLSPPMVAFYSTDSDADFDDLDAQAVSNNGVWGVSNDIFLAANVGGPSQTVTNRSSDTNAPAGDLEEDVTYFNTAEVISSGTGIRYRSASTTWTTVGLSLNASYPTSLSLFDGKNGLMVGNKNTVQLVNTSWTSAVTLTIPEAYYVTSVCSNGTLGYVATRHIANGQARMFTWNGTDTAASGSYPVGSFETFSIKPFGSTVIILTAHGLVSRFDGGGFTPIGQLPPYLRQQEWADAANDYSRASNRGLIADGDVAYLSVSSEYVATYRYRADFPGGLWCLDTSHGLYHKHGPSRTTLRVLGAVTTGNVNTTTNVITTTTAPETGDQIVYVASGGDRIGGLKDATRYYAIKASSTTFKVAATAALASAGTAIDLTSTGNNSQNFLVYAVKDYGWSLPEQRSSVAVLTSDVGSVYAGRYVMGATLYATSAGNRVDHTVWNVPALLCDNRGYFRTPRLNSYEVTDGFTEVAIKHRPLEAGEKIVVKYRTAEKAMPTEIPSTPVSYVQGTFTSTTVFTTTRDLSQVSAGDEVEIVSGAGAGCLAHVSTIAEASGTYTVTLDEAIPGAAADELFDFVVDNWSKIYTIESTTEAAGEVVNTADGYAVFPVPALGKFIELKVEVRGRGRFIEELQVGNAPQLRLQTSRVV